MLREMGSAGALRNIVRPLSVASARALLPRISTNASMAPICFALPSPCKPPQRLLPLWSHFHSLTDTRFPKRRPSERPRRKRASLRPSGPYALVQYTPGQPILPNKPNEGSVKRRNEKKHMRQRRAFILLRASPGTTVKLCFGDLLVMGLNPETPLCKCKGKAAYNISSSYLCVARSLCAMGRKGRKGILSCKGPIGRKIFRG